MYYYEYAGLIFTNTPSNGRSDAIERTFIAGFVYDSSFLFNVIFQMKFDTLYRYPGHDGKDTSRDQFIYYILSHILLGWSILDHPFRISEKFTHTLGTWLWYHKLKGKKGYYWIALPGLVFHVIVNSLFGLMFTKELTQDEWLASPLKATRFQKTLSKMMFPVYAMHVQAWMLRVLPDSLLKKTCQFLLNIITPRHNYVIKALLGYYVDRSEYKPMSNNRWTTVLNERNDRDLYLIEDERPLDLDYLNKLFSGTEKPCI